MRRSRISNLKPATRRILHFRDFSFADFRTRTPGPPPFSSMNSMSAAAFSLRRRAGSHRSCFGGFRRRTPGPPPFSSMNSMPRSSSPGRLKAPPSLAAGKLGSFRKRSVADRFLPLLLWRFSKAHTGSTTVLVDELDAAASGGQDNRQQVDAITASASAAFQAGHRVRHRSDELNAGSLEGAFYNTSMVDRRGSLGPEAIRFVSQKSRWLASLLHWRNAPLSTRSFRQDLKSRILDRRSSPQYRADAGEPALWELLGRVLVDWAMEERSKLRGRGSCGGTSNDGG